jgi:hypothetical protein
MRANIVIDDALMKKAMGVAREGWSGPRGRRST